MAGAMSARGLALMPWPAELRRRPGRFLLTAGFTAARRGPDAKRVGAALARLLRAWERRSGLKFAAASRRPGLVVECAAAGERPPRLGEDEAYELEVAPGRMVLRAPTSTGVMRGLATLEQLLGRAHGRWSVPAVTIRDRPRFPWRGLMLDVVRHWISPAAILRQLDGMALVKLNVLHLHLTDDQGFRVESRTHPRLHGAGSDGNFLTHRRIRRIVAAATARGIRVLPEYDVPGHASSWLAGYPRLASAPGADAPERRWGVHDAVLDPTNEGVYSLLADFLGEMAGLFPDEFVHLGGDENNGRHWKASASIRAFICEHGLGDNAGLQAHFNRRVAALLARLGKRMVGWDEILHPELPAGSVIQSWRGAASLAEAARRGFGGILSSGFYLDHCQPAGWHYARDPLPAATALTAEERARVLGGEAAMWTEWVSEATLDGRIWPRGAAIAERLWSPPEVRDASGMYRRLAGLSQRLAEAGLRLELPPGAAGQELLGEAATEAERRALDSSPRAVEPVDYRRSRACSREPTSSRPCPASPSGRGRTAPRRGSWHGRRRPCCSAGRPAGRGPGPR